MHDTVIRGSTIQRGRGDRAAPVNGDLNLADHDLTGARAGAVIRPQREAALG